MRELLFDDLFGLRNRRCRHQGYGHQRLHRRLRGLLRFDLVLNFGRLLGHLGLLGFCHHNAGLARFGCRTDVHWHRGFERLKDRVVCRVRVAPVAILAVVLCHVGQDSPARRTDFRVAVSIPFRRVVSAGVAVVPLVLLEESEFVTAGWTRKADHANLAEAEDRE